VNVPRGPVSTARWQSWRRRALSWTWALLGGLASLAPVSTRAQDMFAGVAFNEAMPLPPPAEVGLYGLASGRFEIIARDSAVAAQVGQLADAAWAAWREPLALPPTFPVGITVRVVPGAVPSAAASPTIWWRVVRQPSGLVTVWLREAALADERLTLRALAAGALARQATALGVPLDRPLPAWLVHGAAAAAQIERQQAWTSAWAQRARAAARPSLAAVWTWQPAAGVGAAANGDSAELAALALWRWQIDVGARDVAWRRLLAAALRGEDIATAWSSAYGARAPYANAEEAWASAWWTQATASQEAIWSPADSRRWLEEMDRIVLRNEAAADVALPLSALWTSRAAPAVVQTRTLRLSLLRGEKARLHPFYTNALLSLGRAWQAQEGDRLRAWEQARADWVQDLAIGDELAAASAQALGPPTW
jgi:hypothetical protein